MSFAGAAPMGTAAGTGSAIGGGGAAPLAAPMFDFGASCDPQREVAQPLPALLVRDPEVLADFSLERVLTQLIAASGAELTPLELVQRLFDTESTTAEAVFADNIHCDADSNPAFAVTPATNCPRAEARLAKSAGLLTPGDADFFAPVALVNRFDLMPSDASTCGEYRVVFAKQSGLTDPSDRVFLSFDATLANPSRVFSNCRPVAELWASLVELTADEQREQLGALFFDGIATLPAVLTVESLSATSSRCEYAGICGRVRLAQGMQEPFEFRQFQASTLQLPAPQPKLWFTPWTNSGSLRPELFDLARLNEQDTMSRRALPGGNGGLLVSDINRLSMDSLSHLEVGETAVAGPARPNFRERVLASREQDQDALDDAWRHILTSASATCPTDDWLSPLGIVERVTALSCAGCHAPEQTLAEGRRLSCGVVWPESLGVTHIDEAGELSPALLDVFLPYRQQVLTTYLQACDAQQALKNVRPVPPEFYGL